MGHPRKNIAFLAAEIALQLDNRRAPGDIDPATVINEVTLVFQFAERSPETLAQQFGDETPQRLMARARRHRTDNLGKAIAPPAMRHFSSTIVGMAVAVHAAKKYDLPMPYIQDDLFAQDNAKRNCISEDMLVALRVRLEATLARLEATEVFPWPDPLDAVHEENRFQRGAEMLGEEGALLWARFDVVMDRLYATQG